MTIDSLGWDLGGAHLKAVALNAEGQIVHVTQQACPLWQGIHTLNEALDQMARTMPFNEARTHAVTMTGELADLFVNRRAGVRSLIEAMRTQISGSEPMFFAGPAGLLAADSIRDRHLDLIASANWLAAGQWVAARCERGLLLDVGSTTTDLILLMNGEVHTQGYTDCERLSYDEIVYHGIVRTPVMTIADNAPFEGHWVTLMNEQFATAADIYRLTGELPEHADQHPAADGGMRDMASSTRRLARMIGRDADSSALPRWRTLARYFRERQLGRIVRAVWRQLSRLDEPDSTLLIGAGIGRFLVEDIAGRLGLGYRDAGDWLAVGRGNMAFSAADCLPAVAVAYLGRERV